MVRLLKGAEVTAAIDAELKTRIARLKEQGVTPTLALIRVGERGDDISYERSLLKRCGRLEVEARSFVLPESAVTCQVTELIEEINRDPAIHGCLIFRPLPAAIDDEAVRRTLSPDKDLDGITDGSLTGVLTASGQGYPPCTAQACIEIADHFGIGLSGRRAVVLGRSLVVGKPLALMLMNRNATVTVCHSRTEELAARCREAELLFACLGRAEMVNKDFLAPGQILIDVGINVRPDGTLVGDMNFADAEALAAAVTPVPGGVGAVTTSVLIKHLVEAAEKAQLTKADEL